VIASLTVSYAALWIPERTAFEVHYDASGNVIKVEVIF
jgi:hypothetical protein